MTTLTIGDSSYKITVFILIFGNLLWITGLVFSMSTLWGIGMGMLFTLVIELIYNQFIVKHDKQ